MLFAEQMVAVRGGGDLATGAIAAVHKAGLPVVVLELASPLAVRRTVSVAAAVTEGAVAVDEIEAVRVEGAGDAERIARGGEIPVLVSDRLPRFDEPATVVVDARMAKRNLGTRIDDAPFVVTLGPGFTAGVDCDAVVETQRGHRLGRVIWDGSAAPDSGVPGLLGGAGAERVVRAPHEGRVTWSRSIGDQVAAGERLGVVNETAVLAAIGGVVRGLITPGRVVSAGLKIGDIDPRGNRAACFEISDKSRLVGAGVLEAILVWLNRVRG